MISIFVTIKVKQGKMEDFIKAVYDDAKGSVRDEPGCYRFDVLRDSKDPNLLHLYEVYADQAALEAHRKMPHYTKWRSIVDPWFDGPAQRVEMTTLFPSDAGWKKQKPNLVNW
ncbi:MAG: antibiotic biosynthesis monooxygenase [SAR202 cluster bacterium]|jgi:quinol monooxygenase YgiN|nr:antibiotic biosynthesis monooxygenase [SAR202 cluster bacterium]